MPARTRDRYSDDPQPQVEVLEAVRQGRSYFVVLTPEEAALARRRDASPSYAPAAPAPRTPWTLLSVLLVASVIVIMTWLSPPQPLVLSNWDGRAGIVGEARPAQVISGVAEPQP
jgi:hypothetical protein